MAYSARKRMRAAGRIYAAGAQVPLADLPPKVQRQLVDQRKVVFEEDTPEDIETHGQKKVVLARRRS